MKFSIVFYKIKRKKLQVKTNGKIYTAYGGKINGKSQASVSKEKYKKPRFQYISTTGNKVSLVNLFALFYILQDIYRSSFGDESSRNNRAIL